MARLTKDGKLDKRNPHASRNQPPIKQPKIFNDNDNNMSETTNEQPTGDYKPNIPETKDSVSETFNSGNYTESNEIKVEPSGVQDIPHQAMPFESSTSNDEKDSIISKLGLDDSADKAQAEYNPFAGERVLRGEHAKVTVDTTITEEIPSFTPPPMDRVMNEQPKEPLPPLNPDMNKLNDADQKAAAERMVDMVFQLYGMAVKWAGTKAQFPVEEIIKLHADNKIDMNYPFPVSEAETQPFIDVIKSFNSQSKEAFEVSPEFIAKVRQPMINEFMKRGIGLTDIQAIAVFWGIELLQKNMLFFSFRSTVREMVQAQLGFHAKMLSSQQAKATPPPTPQPRKDDKVYEPEILEAGEVKGQ